MMSKAVMNIPNHKLSSSPRITAYGWYRSKALHYPVGLSPEQETSLHSQTIRLQHQFTHIRVPSSSATQCIAVNRLRFCF